MKAILFLSFLIFFVDITFSTLSETAETIDTAFQAVDDGEKEMSDSENAMDTDDGIEKNEDTANDQDLRIRLTPGKDIILTITPNGPANGGGVTYTRWGKMTCRQGAQLVYEGYAGGGYFNHKGNGANYLCLPKDPEYLSTTAPSHQSFLYGAEYESHNRVFSRNVHNYNVPCAVCHAPKKSTKLMIPAKTSCPTSWTREYYGYLMTEYRDHNRNSLYECVDHNPDLISGTGKDINGALFHFVEAVYGVGLPCGPYVAKRAITCAVCTK